MDVSPVGPGSANIPSALKPAGVQSPAAATASAGDSAIASDNVATLIELLALPAVADLFTAVDQRIAPANPASAEPLLIAVRSAVAANDIPLALTRIREFIDSHPQRAEALASDPSLHAIRGDVQNIVRLLTLQARTTAEFRLDTAARAIAIAGVHKIANTEIDSQRVLSLAGYLLESGRLMDLLRSAELAQLVIAQYSELAPTVAAAGKKVPRTEVDLISGVSRLWKRAPLLVLLAGWFGVGLIAAVLTLAWGGLRPQLEIWGLGFLALVGFGFYTRIRNVRF